MNFSAEVIAHIINETNLFSYQFLGVTPNTVYADCHDKSITITLNGILTQSEKDSIKENHIAELICKNYLASYNAVRHILETMITSISGISINHSRLMIDPDANIGTILCTFEN